MKQTEPPPAAPTRILIVEDDIHARAYLSRLVATERGVVVVGQAKDGHEALRLIATTKPDLVFLDIQIPYFDGFQVIAKVDSGSMPAFIFVTAYSDYAVRAFEIDALDYICKPFDQSRVHAAIRRFMRFQGRNSGWHGQRPAAGNGRTHGSAEVADSCRAGP